MNSSRLIAVTAIVGLMVVGGVAFWAQQTVRTPFKGYDTDEIFFAITRGTSGTEVARKLQDKGIIQNHFLFLMALRLHGENTYIQAGEYRFSETISTIKVINRLIQGDIHTVSVTIPEGLTLAETAEHLEKIGVGNAKSLKHAFSDIELINSIDPDASDLEGYLFPTTYQFTLNPSPTEVVRAIIFQFVKSFDQERQAKAKEAGLDVRKIVTLASIVEKETGQPDERPLISSVFWNRLQRGMPLGSDPTIIYALKIAGTYDGNLRKRNLNLDSPYNTYRYRGLPPGPIASPGLEAIDAVLEPKNSSYLYFVSKNDGSHHFSKTLREHNRAVRKYQIDYFRLQKRINQSGGSSSYSPDL